MSHTMTTQTRVRRLVPVYAAAIAVTEFGRHITRAARLRRDRRLLAELSDHTLHDIGISRYEIDSITSWGPRDLSRRSRG